MLNERDKVPGSPTLEQGPTPAYEVGFGKPPRASQFNKGTSGNPKGRPKAADISDIAPLIEGIFSEPIKMREGEQIRTISNLEAMLRAQVTLALKGEPKAIRTVFNLGVKAGLFTKSQQKSFIEIVEPGGEAGRILRGYHAQKAGEFAKVCAVDAALRMRAASPGNNAEEKESSP